MVFSSLSFLLYFFPIVLFLYFIRKDIKWRNGVLLVASLFFYAWGEPIWIVAMLASTVVNYFAARQIVREKNKKKRRMWMILGVGISAAFLFVFKYAAFIVNSTLGLISPSLKIPVLELPIGISFYTFQVITYTVDVYLKKQKAQKRFSRLLLYVSCFPQLIAGPIVQYNDVATQLSKRTSTPDKFSEGMQRFIIGLGKKVIFANICGAALTKMPLAGGEAAMSVLGAWYAAFLYTLQIYFDFYGYSCMAIGLGKIFGFDYKENFDHPYASFSVREFWRRWHISLGSFFRDYVYIPLGGNRKGLKRTVINTLVVWSLTGFWHGANWTFLVWGAYYGIILTIDLLGGRKITNALPKPVNWLITMVLVMISWVIFYYPTLGQAFSHIGAMFGIGVSAIDDISIQIIKTYSVFPLIAFIASLPVTTWLKKLSFVKNETVLSNALKLIYLTACLILSVFFLVGQSYNPFIYFQF